MAGSSSASRLSNAALWLADSSSGNAMTSAGFIRLLPPSYKKNRGHSTQKCWALIIGQGALEKDGSISLTPRFSGGGVRVAELFNRFNGFLCVCRSVRNVLGRALDYWISDCLSATVNR